MQTQAYADLTPREKEVIQAMIDCDGQFSAVADKLVISETTVKTHINNIYSKMGVHSKGSMVIASIKAGVAKC